MTKFWMNTTSSSNWNSTPVGIIRVERELSMRLVHEPFLIDGAGFKRNELDSIPKHEKEANKADKNSYHRNKAHGFLLSARMLSRKKRIVKSIAYFVSSFYGISTRLDHALDKAVLYSYKFILSIFVRRVGNKKMFIPSKSFEDSSSLVKTPDIHFPFSEGDIVFTCGLDWDNSILEKLYLIKKDINLNLVTVIYDLIPISNPEFIQNTRHVNRLLGHFTLLAQLSTLVLVNTEATAKEFRELCAQLDLRVPETRIVPWGVGFDPALEPKEVPGVLSKMKTTDFFLAVGTLEIRKNYQLLVNVIKLAKEQNQIIPHFVFVGTPGWGTHELQIQIENDELLQNSITWLKGTTDEQLIWLYQNCSALLSPSFGEGFGLPVAEAQFFGKTTYISDIPVYRELFSNSIFISPNDPAAWLLAITQGNQSKPDSVPIHNWDDSAKFVAVAISDFFGTEIKYSGK
jgi:glycosyltransferase involved in cell wall biosynthesis